MQTTNDNLDNSVIHKLLVPKAFNIYMKTQGNSLYNLTELPFYTKFDRYNDSLICITLNNYSY